MKQINAMAMLLGVCIFVGGCSDADRSWHTAYGSKFYVTTRSGGVIDGEYISTGSLETVKDSDGWYFVDLVSNKLVVVSGNVTFRQLDASEVETLRQKVVIHNDLREKLLHKQLTFN